MKMTEQMQWVEIKEVDRYGREYTRRELHPVKDDEANKPNLLDHVMQSMIND
jgi:hypothetical protein